MTRIRNLLLWWRIRRAQQRRTNSDCVSFEAFCNETLPENKGPSMKESSLTNKNTFCKISEFQTSSYQQFSTKDEKLKYTWPNFSTVLLILFITMVFMILPVIYLLHCFGVINVESQLLNNPYKHGIKDEVHYEPSQDVHWLLNTSEEGHSSSNLPKNTYISTDYRDLPLPHPPDESQCANVKTEDKFDCFPDDGPNEAECQRRGCCWIPTNITLPLNVPYCYYPTNFQSYVYINITQTSLGVTAFLKRVYKSPFPQDVQVVKMTVTYETENRLHIKITDPSQDRFEPPYPEVPIVDKIATNLSYNLVIDPLQTGFKVVRKADGTVLFDSQGIQNFIFSDQFLQISTRLPSNYIYGLGEHRTNLLLSTNWQRFTMFNHDAVPVGNKNLYGSHPFYLIMENSGNSHGVFLLNSNAMDVILQPTPALTFRTVGGVLDLYFFLGPSPYDVVRQYTEVIGKPFLPPYWALGFHFCRFGFKTLNATRKVWKRIIDAGIPFDTQWNDLDYMQNGNGFTLDKEKFGDLPSFVNELHRLGMHYIPIIDAGISGSEKNGTYFPYDKAIEMDILVKNSTGDIFVGKVWNKGSTVWPDFTHPHIVDYWLLMLKTLHDTFAFDGAWIDMNEPSNFLNGAVNGCPLNSTLESPPYIPGVDGGILRYLTMCMTAKHSIGSHYNVHNLFGFTEAIVTNFALAEIRGKRPVVISRSTFSGLGYYAGHWSGDIFSNWDDMKYSIPELLSFSMFGIPLMGADICGFNGNTTAALCNRWMQLGAFYPFSRNHNTDDAVDQDPVALGSQVVESSVKALKVRYSLLPYLYTLFWSAHVRGSTVATPMFFEFPKDRNTYALDEQFLWGPAILIAPVLVENQLWVAPYLPSGIWYDYYSRETINSTGQTFNLSAPLDTIPVLIRGGYVIPQQEALSTTTASRKTKIQILAASDKFGNGIGQLFWDDGDSLNTVEERRYSLLNFTLTLGNLEIEPEWWWGSDNPPPNLGKVTVLGVRSYVSKVLINKTSHTFNYNSKNQCLTVDNLNISMESKIKISWK